jgi:hypothetical protein
MRGRGAYSALVARGLHMHPVLIECPLTHQLVPTGFEAVDLDELEPSNLLIDCPGCGQDHMWMPSEAVLMAPA